MKLELLKLKGMSKAFLLSIFLFSIMIIAVFLTAKFAPPYAHTVIFLLIIAVIFLYSLLGNILPRIAKIKNQYLSVSLITLLLFIVPLFLGAILITIIAAITNIAAANPVIIFTTYVITTASVNIIILIILRKQIKESPKLIKLSNYFMAALFGTAYGFFDFFQLGSLSENIRALFFGVFVSVLFSRLIIEW